MSTFLEGVQDLAYECDLASVPGAVTGQVGEFADVVRPAWWPEQPTPAVPFSAGSPDGTAQRWGRRSA